jgi:4'-phosphopantetheinyl transferase
MPAPVETAPVELCRWEPGPRHPSLAHGDVHVWRADLRSVDDAILRSLSAGERERAARILNARKARLWARSRGVLRELLARYTGRAPRAIALRLESGGKPRLDGEVSGAELFFNLSHSAWIALFAFSGDGPVGVDVERGRPSLERLVPAAALGQTRTQALDAPPDHPAGAEFLRRWTRAEAVGKCLGTGIGIEAGAAELIPGEAGVRVSDLDLGARAVAALAAIPTPAAVCCFQRRG